MRNNSFSTNLEDIQQKELRQLIFLAISSGRTMLTSGAETYRVEDTIERLCNSHPQIDAADCFVIPTGIFLSIRHDRDPIIYFKRIRSITTDLNKVDMINQLSRDFIDGKMSLEEGFDTLGKIRRSQIYNPVIANIFVSFGAAAFTGTFGANFKDCIISFLVSFISLSIIDLIRNINLVIFIKYLIGGILIAGFTIIAYNLHIADNIDHIIIGTLMPLLPGYSFTNSIRDIMARDYVSGISRMVEAILLATSLALGVGVILRLL